MSALSKKDVEKVAHLARLTFSETQKEQELEQTVKQLSNILELVQQMDAVDTAAVEPMAHPLDLSQRLRKDAVTEINQRELFQSIAPKAEKGQYLVPRVID